MSKAKKINFEQSLQDLEKLVKAMESGDMSLEQSLQAFEKGIKLTRECQLALDAAEQKVTVLLEENALEENAHVFSEEYDEQDDA